MSFLNALVDTQIWLHFFDFISIAYINEVRDFDNDLTFREILLLNASVNRIKFILPTSLFRKIFVVPIFFGHYEG